MRQILLLVERVCQFAVVVVLVTVPSVGVISLEEEVAVHVRRGLSAYSGSHSVHEVARDGGVHRSDIKLAGLLLGARLNEVLYEYLQSEEHVFEVLGVFKVDKK